MDTLDRANSTPVAHESAPGPLVQGGEVAAGALAARLGRWAHGDGTLSTRLAAAIAALIGGGELRPA
ncbi:PLP-dependent aminotransferase family protein, partial [Microbacterium sp. HSID17254]